MSDGPRRAAALWFVPAGFAIGFAGALCGIGGGLFAGPLLHAARGVPLKRAAATAVLVVLATTGTSTVTEVLRPDSQIDWAVAVPLALGALGGAQVGFRVASAIDERALKALFTVVLALAGLRLLVSTTPVAGGVDPGPVAASALALVIGFGGGFLTPLLGIAGGILMVPALFLTMGSLGFGGARACALAAGAVAGLRTLRLHARAGNIEFPLGWPLALGALVGAVGGVQAAHDSTLSHLGRLLLGGILLLQAARFALQLLRARATTA